MLIVTILMGVSACNTIEGIGRDLKGAGNAIEREAKEEK